jgi:hypothetical protein
MTWATLRALGLLRFANLFSVSGFGLWRSDSQLVAQYSGLPPYFALRHDLGDDEGNRGGSVSRQTLHTSPGAK